MGYTVIAPVGDNPKALFVGMKEFATQRVILIVPKEYHKVAAKLKEQLDEFTIDTKIEEIGHNLMEEMFRVIGMAASIHENDDLVVNVATGDRMSTCAALSAAFANGLKAIGVMGKECMLLPVMKLSYYNELNENKLRILKSLPADTYVGLGELSKKLEMSVSLLSYHINGNYKYKGLKEYRLVEVKEKGKTVSVRASEMGRLLLKGYIDPKGKD